MSVQNKDDVQFCLIAINRLNGNKRVLPHVADIFLLKNEELVLESNGAQCPIRFEVEGRQIDHAASRYYDLYARLCPCESNFLVSTWESSRKDVSATVLKVEEGREVFVIARARGTIVHDFLFTVSRAS